MGWLPGCGSQDLEIADTVAESAVTATADATDVITFSQPEGPEESTVYVEQMVRLNSEELNHWLEDYTLGDLWKQNIVKGGQPE